MGTISKGGRTKGSWKFQYAIVLNGKQERPGIYLGPMPEATARIYEKHLNQLVAAKKLGSVLPDDTVNWLSVIGEEMYSKLEKRGLVQRRKVIQQHTISSFIAFYMAERTDVKERTQKTYGLVKGRLEEFFGPDTALQDVNVGTAGDFRRHLERQKELGPNWTKKILSVSKQFFENALDRELIPANPFRKMDKLATQKNIEKFHYITLEEYQAVMAASDNLTMKAVFTLAVVAGMRPHEILLLKWGNIDFEQGRVSIHSTKTEHLHHKGNRQCPLFPECREALEALRNEFLENFDPKQNQLSKEFVIKGYDRPEHLNRPLQKIIRGAGLQVWADLFINCRSTASTRLKEIYPDFVVNKWLGHTERIAQQSYQQVLPKHFENAIHSEMHSNLPPFVSKVDVGTDTDEEAKRPTNVD